MFIHIQVFQKQNASTVHVEGFWLSSSGSSKYAPWVQPQKGFVTWLMHAQTVKAQCTVIVVVILMAQTRACKVQLQKVVVTLMAHACVASCNCMNFITARSVSQLDFEDVDRKAWLLTSCGASMHVEVITTFPKKCNVVILAHLLGMHSKVVKTTTSGHSR